MDAQKWQEIRRRAREQTDREFASEASSLTRLTDEEIENITPSIEDREKLAELMEIVKDHTRSNEEKAKAIRNVKGLAEIAAKVLPLVV